MVKIAFNSPFAQKDEPKKEAAEALVAEKVRGTLPFLVATGGAWQRAGGWGGRGGAGGRRHLLAAAAAGRGRQAAAPPQRSRPLSRRALRSSPALGPLSGAGWGSLSAWGVRETLTP